MNRLFIQASVFTYLSICTAAAVPETSSTGVFTWGACGHPSATHAPWTDPATQLATLAQRGLKSYRFDVSLTSDTQGTIAQLQNLYALASTYGVTLHPILYVPFTWSGDPTDGGRYPATAAGLEAQGYDYVYPIALQFAGEINDWEMENELSLRPGFKSGSGQSISDYATAKAGQWAAVLRGMSRAINDVRTKTGTSLRSVVDTVYVDFGLVPFLESQGVIIDKVAYHYYYTFATTPYKIYPPSGVPVDLFAELGKLGKPVIINELNAGEIYAPAQGKPYNDAQALMSLKAHIGYILGQTEANIEGAEFYELYDEPSKDAVESNFGLMRDPTHGKTQMLLAAVYACGQLTASEQAALVESNLFTASELSARQASCPASH